MHTVLRVSVCVCVKMCNLGPVVLNTTAAYLPVQKYVASVMVMLHELVFSQLVLVCLAVFLLARCAHQRWQIKYTFTVFHSEG